MTITWRSLMLGLLSLQVLHSSYSVCKQFFEFVYFGNLYDMGLWLWLTTFVLFLSYTFTILFVLLAVMNRRYFESVKLKAQFGTVLGLHIMIESLLIFGDIFAGGLSKEPIGIQLEILCWVMSTPALIYFYNKERK